ncbi:hypothetical protein MP228_009816 [Amoeboaphelidium protococcarum]|nr:hypothetical protein MP228_009816 [Amoeboaphelidium protococcarum]
MQNSLLVAEKRGEEKQLHLQKQQQQQNTMPQTRRSKVISMRKPVTRSSSPLPPAANANLNQNDDGKQQEDPHGKADPDRQSSTQTTAAASPQRRQRRRSTMSISNSTKSKQTVDDKNSPTTRTSPGRRRQSLRNSASVQRDPSPRKTDKKQSVGIQDNAGDSARLQNGVESSNDAAALQRLSEELQLANQESKIVPIDQLHQKLPPKPGDLLPPKAIIRINLSAGREKRSIRQQSSSTASQSQLFSETALNHDYCDFCNQSGELVCCESCPRSFHYQCCQPPMDREDYDKLDHWYCPICLQKKVKPRSYEGIFSNLMQNMDSRVKPKAFALPSSIRRYFAGVHCESSTGDYMDESDYRSPQSKRATASINDVDGGNSNNPSSLQSTTAEDGGKSGSAIHFCHQCGQSFVKGTLISCDYCPLHFHMDCLNPPLTIPPQQKDRKWKCPAHADEQRYRRVRKARNANNTIHDVLLEDPALANDGNIEVVLSQRTLDFYNAHYRSRINYRTPEESILLNFVQKAQANHQEEQLKQQELLKSKIIKLAIPKYEDHSKPSDLAVKLEPLIDHHTEQSSSSQVLQQQRPKRPRYNTRSSVSLSDIEEMEVEQQNVNNELADVSDDHQSPTSCIALQVASKDEQNLWLESLASFLQEIGSHLK